ncbi:transcriptional repressor LexA [Lentilactobacillus buchneri]|uniref:LexA repressor n=2 Tax=Lentilactobacillus buchneri TaxID=1581 RepID=J9W152_LENBU|nr:transcriptional repressor LexA [Lentilactobacillus buchneri]MCC6100399.1 transcriptional repressor LexA [Lactobacillus sp.]WCJ51662.1 transcriptional repressor LexA [Lentilactobacillus sp. Egmn17]AEB73221.1 SOS-response transcriptional repressor, LexA [Lentilactobacillus buchneri NRRL B-30929]AFS00139.1 LexA repressor [Lentilactobacillus buchneri subsp. silagei CD034]KRK67851.1 SOS-response transcriptional repressor, LexA [Lentilactobacillus buchneri DSM 20057]
MSKTTNDPQSKQYQILHFIWERVNEQGYPPTVREIGEAVHLSSTSTVHGHIARLERKGYIVKDPAKPRALEVTSSGLDVLGMQPQQKQIPVLGTVTAGEPILAVQEATDYFPLPPALAHSDQPLFMLQIRGESMINAGILDGDYVVVRKQESADNGDIVIAMTDENEATCKRFFKESDHYRLQPENDTMAPIILTKVSILGKVVSLYRSDIS